MTFSEWFVMEINASSDLIKSSKFTQWRKEKVQDSKNTILIGPDVLDSHTGKFGFVREFLEFSNEYLILRIFRFSEFVGSSNWWHCCIFRLTWLIEKRELKIENEKSSESISKILSNIDSALDNRNQNDTNKDSASMEEMRWVFNFPPIC